MKINNIKKRKLTLGGWITMQDSAVAEIMSKAGLDWVVVDLEHSATNLESAAHLIRTIDLCGAIPLVRLTSNNPDQIKRVMDLGAHGIIVPNVKTQEDAVEAVSATRYAPLGNRGVGLGRAQGYGVEFHDYFEWQKNESVVIAMIEHVDALENLSSILSVPGIDGFLIGPYDLSASLGMPGEFENPKFISALNFIRNEGIKRKCIVGIHIVEPDLNLLKKCISDGYNFIAYSVDIRILDVSIRNGIKNIKGLK